MQGLFLIIPLMIPMIQSPRSSVGEKWEMQLEAFPATPIETHLLLVGKCIAAAAPGIPVRLDQLCPVRGALLAGDPRPRVDQIRAAARLARRDGPAWPGAAFLAVVLALLISSRATDSGARPSRSRG